MSEKKHLVYIPSILKSVQEHMTPADFVSTESVRKYVQARMLSLPISGLKLSMTMRIIRTAERFISTRILQPNTPEAISTLFSCCWEMHFMRRFT